MRWQMPTTTEGRLWLTQFNENFAALGAAGFGDDSAAKQTVFALRCLLEREPECAGLVVGLSTHLLFSAEASLPPERTLEIAGLATDADRLRVEADPERALQVSLVEAVVARTSLRRGLPFVAVDHASTAVGAARRAADASPDLAHFLEAGAESVIGEAWDFLLEPTRALEGHRRARELLRGPVEDPERLSPVLLALVPFLYGESADVPDDVVTATLQSVWFAVCGGFVESTIGIARCHRLLGTPEAGASLEDARRAIQKVGPGDANPVLLAGLLRAAPAEAADHFVATLLDMAEQLQLETAGFEAVLWAAQAVAAAERGDDPTDLLALAEEAREDVASPLLIAASAGLALLAAPDEGPDPSGAELDFVDLVAELEHRRDPGLRDLRIRAVLDEPLSRMTGKVAQQLAAADEQETRIQLAELLDSLGEADLRFETLLDGAEMDLVPGADQARDRLGRLLVGLRDRPDTACIVVRDLHPETLFVCCSAQTGTFVARADAAYGEAVRALRDQVAYELDVFAFTGAPAAGAELVTAGRRAFDGLPPRVRDLVAAHGTLLVCPDHRTSGDTVPYELFHDSAGWLGLDRVVARFPTLASVTRAVEGSVRRSPATRALALSVAHAEGLPELVAARDEADLVRRGLVALGWDVPEIEEPRVTTGFLLDRLPFVAHLHVAAHGDASGHDEALVLTGRERLHTDDLLRTFFPRLPTVYLNACSLGSSRYVGAGVSRGIALALVQSGAPAVVANLLPVDDATTQDLADVFYASTEDFGESIRAARSVLAANGTSPLLWGTTVLIGDPRTTLAPARGERPVSEVLLDAYFADPAEVDHDALDVAQEALDSAEVDQRLVAAAGLLSEIADWGSEVDRDLRGPMASALQLALELDHLPTAAMIAYLVTETHDEAEDPDLALRAVEECLQLVEPLDDENSSWGRILDMLLARWMQLRRGERRIEPHVHGGPEGEAATDELLDIGQAVIDAGLAVEARAMRRGDTPQYRDQNTVEAICWNAVLSNRDNSFEGMREKFSFSRAVAERLVVTGAVPAPLLQAAATTCAGLIPWLWSTQHVTDLGREMVQGQAGVLEQLVTSLARDWQTGAAPWVRDLERFSDQVTTALASLDGLPYDEALYRRMGEVMDEVLARARQLLDRFRQEHPERLPDAAAWVLGTLVEKNTYSWADGSVPGDIGEGLERVHAGLAGEGETWFAAWLVEGFRRVREHPYDELERWKIGLPST